jgi:hypothetical protein
MAAHPRLTPNDDGTLLTVEYFGHITAAVMEEHAVEAGSVISKMKPGFTVLSDLTNLESMDPDCVPWLSRVMDQFNRSLVGHIIRVIPDPKKDIGLGILSLFHYTRAVPINTVTTLEEALRLIYTQRHKS